MLAQPGVGLALDPEWRLGPDQVPLKQIGSVSAAEVDATTDWLAASCARRAYRRRCSCCTSSGSA
ncbi:hypothetical protein BC477_15610 [Clavibacter michiganensis subsp. michiganensis]|uniref:Uncharacterized protein n=1 Tax=Clavibacter michiganensis subsp. michiganensis TaxID=33013 RepID=A0A251XGC0_CLAMM|nr:hypothetical protein BC477_15610 [Clavibacter michiganensis subsp. michiganensis]OUE01233.1 hypothetical protein CMMCAS07_13070 [Clavibacter michiganensis subsp. michiganensis]